MNYNDIEPVVFRKTMKSGPISSSRSSIHRAFEPELVYYEKRHDLKLFFLGLGYDYVPYSYAFVNEDFEIFFTTAVILNKFPNTFYDVFIKSPYLVYDADLNDMILFNAYQESHGHFQTLYNLLCLKAL